MLIDSRPIYLFSIISLILVVLSILLLFPILNYWLDFELSHVSQLLYWEHFY